MIKDKSKNKSLSYAYNYRVENWYKALPYGFKKNNEIIYLPISPQNISISTNFATNVITTLYSTVEEHSEVRYFDISIQGTTGISPKYVYDQVKRESKDNSGRMSYSSKALIDNGALGGFGASTINKINNAANKAKDAYNTAKNISKTHESGVFLQNTGYKAFHELYMFFLRHKEEASKGSFKYSEEQPSPLLFLNYKDNNQYSCAVQRFVLERTAENPMLYNYSIQLRAYNLKTLNAKKSSDTFSQKLKSFGLDSNKPSLLARIRNTVQNAKSAINSAGSAISGAGR